MNHTDFQRYCQGITPRKVIRFNTPTVVMRLVIAVFSTVTALIFSASPASAHNTLVSSNPENGAMMASAPLQWVLTFDKSVPLSSASGEVVKSDGVRVALAVPRHGTSDNIIVFDFPPSLSGSSTARWRLIGTDGHVISGRVSFSVDSNVTETDTAAASNQVASIVDNSSPLLSTSRVLLRIINYLSLLLVLGMLFSDKYISEGMLQLGLNSRMTSLSMNALATTTILQLVMFINDARIPTASFLSGATDALSTTPGAMAGMKAVTGGVLAALMSPRFTRTSSSENILKIAVVLFLFTFAYGGHSRSEAAPWLGIPTNMIHVGAMAVWLGGLVVLVFLVAPRLETHESLHAFRRFGFFAERAVIVLSITGTIQLLRMYPNPITLFTGLHGFLLVIKIFVVAAMIYLAAKNRTALISSIETSPRRERMTRQQIMKFSLIEIGLGTAILSLTAIVVGVSPT